jgi:hypothetical protein
MDPFTKALLDTSSLLQSRYYYSLLLPPIQRGLTLYKKENFWSRVADCCKGSRRRSRKERERDWIRNRSTLWFLFRESVSWIGFIPPTNQIWYYLEEPTYGYKEPLLFLQPSPPSTFHSFLFTRLIFNPEIIIPLSSLRSFSLRESEIGFIATVIRTVITSHHIIESFVIFALLIWMGSKSIFRSFTKAYKLTTTNPERGEEMEYAMPCTANNTPRVFQAMILYNQTIYTIQNFPRKVSTTQWRWDSFFLHSHHHETWNAIN